MYRPAGFWIRLGANLLDGLIVSLPITLFFNLISHNSAEGITNFVTFVYGLITPVLWTGYVVGKKLAGVRIVKMDGSNVTIGTMVLRVVIGGLVYLVTIGIGLIISAFMVGLRDDKRSIHDLIAGTYVTYASPDEMDRIQKNPY